MCVCVLIWVFGCEGDDDVVCIGSVAMSGALFARAREDERFSKLCILCLVIIINIVGEKN